MSSCQNTPFSISNREDVARIFVKFVKFWFARKIKFVALVKVLKFLKTVKAIKVVLSFTRF